MAAKYLSQVLGIEKEVSARAIAELTDVYQLLPVKQAFEGQRHTYATLIEDADVQPDKPVRVQATVKEQLARIRPYLIDMFDIVAARDFTNGPGPAGAVADVVYGEFVLIQDAPVPYLLWLEGQLKWLRKVAEAIQTLSPQDDWTIDDPSRGIWCSGITTTFNQRKRPEYKIVAPEGKFAAQVMGYEITENVGEWTKVKLSGAIKPEEKAELIRRIEGLLASVVAAQRVANQVEAANVSVGAALVSHLFD